MATTENLLSELRRRHSLSDAMNQGRPDPIWEHIIVTIEALQSVVRRQEQTIESYENNPSRESSGNE